MEIVWENISAVFSESISIGKHCFQTKKLCFTQENCVKTVCEHCTILAAYQNKRNLCQEKVLRSGKTVEMTVIPIYREEELKGTILKIEDITERKSLHTKLEDALIKAEQSEQLKTAFLASLSHEIRTPLNAIVGFSEYVQMAKTDEERNTYQQILQNNTNSLITIINDLVDLSKLETGDSDNTMDHEFDISDLFSEIHCMWKNKIEGLDFRLNLPKDKYLIVSDKNRLLQIMNNFISNAKKFTLQGYIEIGYQYENNELTLYCKDSGIGISEKDQQKIFTRFEKVNSFTQGMGLGLTISERIVRLKNGIIGVNSKENEGSIFWCKIPCKKIETTLLT